MNICLNILFLIKLNYGGNYFTPKSSQLERVEFHILLPYTTLFCKNKTRHLKQINKSSFTSLNFYESTYHLKFMKRFILIPWDFFFMILICPDTRTTSSFITWISNHWKFLSCCRDPFTWMMNQQTQVKHYKIYKIKLFPLPVIYLKVL